MITNKLFAKNSRLKTHIFFLLYFGFLQIGRIKFVVQMHGFSKDVKLPPRHDWLAVGVGRVGCNEAGDASELFEDLDILMVGREGVGGTCEMICHKTPHKYRNLGV